MTAKKRSKRIEEFRKVFHPSWQRHQEGILKLAGIDENHEKYRMLMAIFANFEGKVFRQAINMLRNTP